MSLDPNFVVSFLGHPSDYHHLRSFSSACFVLLQPHEQNKLEPRSRLCYFLGYDKTQKGYRCYYPVSHCLHVSQNVVFWEHHSFVELSHFRSSLTTSSVLEIFSDEPHLPSTLDPPLDFYIQLPDIFDASLGSPSNEQEEDEQVDDELPHFELESLAPALPEDFPQDILPHPSTQVRSIPAHLLDYHCYTAFAILHKPHTYHEASTNHLWQIAMKEKLDALSQKTILGIWLLSLLDSQWLVVSGSTRSRLALISSLSVIRLVLLRKVLHRSIGLIMKRPLLRFLVFHLFVPF